MQEIARVTLENEMDLIIAHRRSMKLAELAGLSLPAQTTFATAVSEVSRNSIESGKKTKLILSIVAGKRENYIVACLKNEQSINERSKEGLEYAKKLVNKYQVSTRGAETSIELFFYIPHAGKIDLHLIDEWRNLFRNEPPLTPYDELKRKNEQLRELSEKLQKSESQYKILTNTLPLIIFSIDGEGCLLYANEWLTGYTGESIHTLNESLWKTVIHEEDYESFAVIFKNTLTQGASTVRVQSRLKNKQENKYFWHQISLTPFLDDKQELKYRIGYIVDIHAQKEFEATLKDNIELKQTQQYLKDNQQILEKYISELNRSNEELAQFAYIASHDLQEPVRKLMFYSDYLMSNYNELFDEKGAGFLKSMQQSSQRMRNLIQDLLLFSQIDRNRLALKKIDLDKIINEACQDLEIVIKEKNASFNIQPLPQMQGDENMMRQLFTNIISNALKYSKAGGPVIININWEHKNDNIEITVSDNGIGFDQKYQDQIFVLFQRLHPKGQYEGTGLGLAICRKIAELHNGKIEARSVEGEGSAFYLTLPANIVHF